MSELFYILLDVLSCLTIACVCAVAGIALVLMIACAVDIVKERMEDDHET